MRKILVWDLPNRVFHWAFAGSLAVALAFGFLVDDEQPLFELHMLLGIVALFFLVVRLGMGVMGSRYSRFSSYPVHPREVVEYMVSAVVGKTRLYAGNNPGSAMAALLMFVLVPALFISGIDHRGDVAEELHEVFAWALLAVVLMHLAGLAWHTIRHRENIALAMVTGRKTGRREDSILSDHRLWGVAFLVVSAVWIAALFAGHNPGTGTVRLPGIGVTVDLGDEGAEEGEPERERD